MNWSLASSTMEQRVIKTDVIASEDAYFMATHVPFTKLDVSRGGSQMDGGPALHWSEEDVYQRLVYNPDNIHRLIIVRGQNGTGKSHLIRWLSARYQNDKDHYDETTEKVIFLRRLSNTIRGAVKQILDEGIVFDPKMREKLEKFVSSNQAMDPDSMKLDIYHRYIAAVEGDSSNKTFGKGVRRDIAAFLTDTRVGQFMLRTGGPVDRCFTMITAPTDKVLHGEPTFAEDDFKLPKDAKRGIKKSGSEEAQSILDEIADDLFVAKLIKYLNGFTPAVIQACSEISSEGTKEIFLQLRRAMKQQGKNLTIFIEDFTAFTGMDAELLTVLAAEHGGENKDLCRVTSVIGITDQYYKQFRGNFTDRVQYQVIVGPDAYGSQEFLVEMTARYLNAIYCNPKKIDDWFQQGANASTLPHSKFSPDYPWETVNIDGKDLTLYPFNKKSILSLYNGLNSTGAENARYIKTPRMFLLYVIQEQMTRFFDGMMYGQWNFPSESCIDCPIQLEDIAQDSVIDGMNHLSAEDRRRVKLLLQFWGNSTASEVSDTIGAVPKKFFAEVALDKFVGLPGDGTTPAPIPKPDGGEDDVIDEAAAKRKKNLQDRLSDLNAWISTGATLNYSADYRKWVRSFLMESINWVADGVPAYVANKKLHNASAVFIDGQKETTTKEKAVVVLERDKDTKDLLTALTYRAYSNSWGFKGGLYFQLRTISWLETHRAHIIAEVAQNIGYGQNDPTVRFGVAVEYLQAAFLGCEIPKGNRLQAAQKVLEDKKTDPMKKTRASANRAWQDAIQYLHTQESTYSDCHEMLKESLRTHMGKVEELHKMKGFFRSAELLDVIDLYEAHNWRLTEALADATCSGSHPAAYYLNKLLGKVKNATDEEDRATAVILDRLKYHLGEISKDHILRVLTAITNMYHTLNSNNKPVGNMNNAFITDSAAKAQEVVENYEKLTAALEETDPVSKLVLYTTDPLEPLAKLAKYLDEVEKLVTTTMNTVKQEKASISNGKDISAIAQKGRDFLKKAMDAIDELEVADYAD